LSVSRVGGSAQNKAMRKVAGSLRLDLAQYRELAAFAQFGSDLDKATQNQLAKGVRMVELLKQGQYTPMAVQDQVVEIFLGISGLLDDVPVDEVQAFNKGFLEYFRSHEDETLATLRDKKEMTDEIRATITAAVETYKAERGVAVKEG
ncbi:MAG: F0F1 ATP synthase subunit alpha, partial [bacterium]|nr:F0F1 ATP synthase subunit alpha [bacterium]